jgi:phenylpropionate dioxygenase-like ring-hydroxylating dioxygenase large terminal subunit
LAGTELTRHVAYPCQEAGGVVFAYLGPPELQPPVPDFGWLAVANDQRFAMKRWQDCHWLQALEVDIDSSHVPWLHREELLNAREDPKAEVLLRETAPELFTEDRPFGLLIGARRDVSEELVYWRVNQWMVPWYTFIPAESDDEVLGVHAWVPIDDEHCWVWGFSWHRNRALAAGELEDWRAGRGGRFPELIRVTYQPRRNMQNDWLLDRIAQASGRLWMGIEGNQEQDDAITASMGGRYDRTRERLVPADGGVIATRRRLLEALRAEERGEEPPGIGGVGFDVRPISVELTRDEDWVSAVERMIAGHTG